MNDTVNASSELRQLKYFLALVEERSMTRAAVRLNISPPPLRQQIMQLEGRLGVCLFRKISSEIALTPAGVAFVPEASSRITQMQETQRTQKNASDPKQIRLESGTQRLRIGIVGTAMWGPLAAHLQRFHHGFPQHPWMLQECDLDAQLSGLEAGTIDIAISRESGLNAKTLQGCGLVQKLYCREDVAVAMREDHRLARGRTIALPDLDSAGMVSFNSHEPKFYEYLEKCCRDAGFIPCVVKRLPNLQSMLSAISRGLEVALVPESISRISWPGIVFKRLENSPSANLYLIYRADNRDESLRAFVSNIAVIKRP